MDRYQVKGPMTRILRSALCFALLLASGAAFSANSAVFLQYHHVSDKTPAVTSIKPEMFKQHLDYLAKNGFKVESITKVISALQKGEPLPEKTVVITFDDAYRNIYENAFPLLKEKGWPFTIFVSTEPVDRGFGKFLSWDQINEMARAGATIANHTISHPHMAERKPEEITEDWVNRARKEIEETEKRIQQMTGQSVKMFAWPFGETAPELRKLLDDMGYVGFGQQSGAVGPLSDFTRLPRYPMSGSYTDLGGFRTKINTRPLPVKEQTPESAIISEKNLMPELELSLTGDGFQKNQLRCYASNFGELEVNWLDEEKTRFTTQTKAPLPVGRSRYNCTAPSMDGRNYYWYSHQWLRFTEDGKALD